MASSHSLKTAEKVEVKQQNNIPGWVQWPFNLFELKLFIDLFFYFKHMNKTMAATVHLALVQKCCSWCSRAITSLKNKTNTKPQIVLNMKIKLQMHSAARRSPGLAVKSRYWRSVLRTSGFILGTTLGCSMR